ncbi:MAG: hypothetical protein ACRDQ7_28095 [Haloechinothrix sp.]
MRARDNGFAAVGDVDRLQRICESLGLEHIDALLRKGLPILPNPFTDADETAGRPAGTPGRTGRGRGRTGRLGDAGAGARRRFRALSHRPRKLLKAAKGADRSRGGLSSLGRRNRVVSALAGTAYLPQASAPASVFAAGVESTRDPKYVVVPQRERTDVMYRNGRTPVD